MVAHPIKSSLRIKRTNKRPFLNIRSNFPQQHLMYITRSTNYEQLCALWNLLWVITHNINLPSNLSFVLPSRSLACTGYNISPFFGSSCHHVDHVVGFRSHDTGREVGSISPSEDAYLLIDQNCKKEITCVLLDSIDLKKIYIYY